jgi:hypothetical protein|tara:strand:- start:3 stop:242 length:240 start_codon:yes stop_codon:yes gene_type:complete
MDNSLFNPLVNSLSELSENELVDKINELSRKYFMVNNPEVQYQISAILDMYNSEVASRQAIAANNENGDKSLDNLINIS